MGATKQSGSGSKRRKRGDWQLIAVGRARAHADRTIIHHNNRDIPSMTDSGSAAYRRLLRKRGVR